MSVAKKKVKGAIIQGKESKAAYDIARGTTLSLRKQTQTPSAKKSAAATYKAATSSLKNKKVPTSARGMVQNARAAAAGRLSVINARNTKKVSGPKSKRGN